VELINTCEARHNGRRFCKTAGSEHYRQGAIEPMDLIHRPRTGRRSLPGEYY